MILIYLLAFFGLVLFFSGIRIINQYERGVKFRLGRFVGVLQPGFRWIIPVIEKIEKVDVRVITVDIPSQEVMTQDNVPIKVNGVVFFKVLNADKAVLEVLEHTRYIFGPEVTRFEEEIAAYCGAEYAVGVASGTDALLIALRACGIKEGDEIITSTFSFFASAGVISRLGARPVFIDIEPETYNLNPGLIENAITEKTRVIMPILWMLHSNGGAG